MLMSRHCRGGRERQRGSRVRHLVLLEQQLDTRDIGTDERVVGDHDRLMTVADVIGEERPLRCAARLDDEDRFRPFDHGDDQLLSVEHEKVSRVKHRAARKRRAEFDAAIRPPPPMHMRAIFPAQGNSVSLVVAGPFGKFGLSIETCNDNHEFQH